MIITTMPTEVVVISLLLAVLVGSMLMPVLAVATRLFVRMGVSVLRAIAHMARDEFLKWLLIAIAGAMGLLKSCPDWPIEQFEVVLRCAILV